METFNGEKLNKLFFKNSKQLIFSRLLFFIFYWKEFYNFFMLQNYHELLKK